MLELSRVYLLVSLELFVLGTLRPLLPFLHGSVSKVVGCSLDITSGFITWILTYVARSVCLSLLAYLSLLLFSHPWSVFTTCGDIVPSFFMW